MAWKCNQLQPSARFGLLIRSKEKTCCMATQTFSKFIRPEEIARGHISDRDLDILEAGFSFYIFPPFEGRARGGGNEQSIPPRTVPTTARSMIYTRDLTRMRPPQAPLLHLGRRQ